MNQTQISTKRRLFKRSKPKKNEVKKESTKNVSVKLPTKEKVVVPPQEKKQKRRFPKISRFIPELSKISLGNPKLPSFKSYVKSLKNYGQTKLLFAGVLSLFAILLSGFVAVFFYNVYASWSQEMAKRQQLYTQMQLWDNITKTYPTYRDAYFKGALIAYQLGDSQKLRYFLDKLHLLDPNFSLTTPLEKLDTVQELGGK